jgi:hypothetical protein
MEEKRRAILLIWAVLIALSLLAVACNPTRESRETQPDPTAQVGTASVEQVGTASVEQVGTASVEQVGSASVEQTEPTTGPVQEQAVPTKGTEEQVTPPPSDVTPPVTQALTPTLVFGYTEQGREHALIQKQLGDFEYTSVVGRQYGEQATLVLAFVAGEVDVAALAYNQVGLLYERGVLRYLDQWSEGILPDALESVRFGPEDEELVFGLPWRRSACVEHYYYLVVNSAAPDESYNLVQFLTEDSQQGERYDSLGWFPTLECCYDWHSSYGCDGLCGPVSCPPESPPYRVLRLAPEEIAPTIALANERLPHLDAVLGQIEMNTAGAVSAFDDEDQRLSTAVALAEPVTTEGFRTQLRTEGAYVGALFVDSDPEYPPGDYAVWWKCDKEPCTQPNSQVYLIPPGLNGKPRVIPVQFESFEETGAQVGPPFTQVEVGSRWICWYVDGLRVCIRVGRR